MGLETPAPPLTDASLGLSFLPCRGHESGADRRTVRRRCTQRLHRVESSYRMIDKGDLLFSSARDGLISEVDHDLLFTVG